jgi:hypothetical protein
MIRFFNYLADPIHNGVGTQEGSYLYQRRSNGNLARLTFTPGAAKQAVLGAIDEVADRDLIETIVVGSRLAAELLLCGGIITEGKLKWARFSKDSQFLEIPFVEVDGLIVTVRVTKAKPMQVKILDPDGKRL